ncbi:hypothetical protein Tco_1193101 [Tanacetum coccineum]
MDITFSIFYPSTILKTPHTHKFSTLHSRLSHTLTLEDDMRLALTFIYSGGEDTAMCVSRKVRRGVTRSVVLGSRHFECEVSDRDICVIIQYLGVLMEHRAEVLLEEGCARVCGTVLSITVYGLLERIVHLTSHIGYLTFYLAVWLAAITLPLWREMLRNDDRMRRHICLTRIRGLLERGSPYMTESGQGSQYYPHSTRLTVFISHTECLVRM